MLLQDQEQIAAGRRIANITTTNSIDTSYKEGGRPSVQSNSSRYSFREDENASQRPREGFLVERIQRRLFPVQTRTLAKNGFFVCLLPQTVVVLSKIIEWVQVLQRPVQRLGAPVGGGWDDRRSHFEQQHIGGLFDGRGHRGQRMERVQEIFRQSGHVPVCLHHLRQSLDRIENLWARHSL